MVSRAMARFVRISPRKVRYVIDLIRKKSVPQAQGILNGSPRRATEIVQKLLKSALDAADKNSHLKARDLFISKIMADGGPVMKRFRAASMGRASVIRKRTSHIYLELDQLKKMPVGSVSLKASDKTVEKKTLPPSHAAKTTKKIQKKLVGAK